MISVEGITKRFGDLVAVQDVSFEIRKGEVVGFLGPNGAGKTTTMRMLTGTLEPDEGRILYDGKPIDEALGPAKERVGYLPEANPLYDEMLVAEYLEFAGRLRDLKGVVLREHIRQAREETGIGEVFFRPISELSKGYRQRVGFAAAILSQPEILVLDEPTEGLDPNQRVDIRRLVRSLGRERTVLISTHVLQEVEATCNRLLIIHRGKLVADGSVTELRALRKGFSTYVVEAEGDGVGGALAQLPGVDSHEEEKVDGRSRVRLRVSGVSGDGELRPRISRIASERGWVLWELHREKVTLEQLFRELTGEVWEQEGTL